MNKKFLKVLVCTLLIASFVMTSMSALAAEFFIVNTDGARLRGGSNRTRIITSLNRGTRVAYIGKSHGSMYCVCTASGQIGYIYNKYLSYYGAAPTSQVYRCARDTAFYGRSGNKPVRKGTLDKGTVVIVYETRGSWAYVRTLSGRSGYLKTGNLKR